MLAGISRREDLVRQGTPADAVYRPTVDDLAGFQPLEQHAVGMEGQHDLRLPDDLGRGDGLQHRKDRHVGEVSLARGGKRSVGVSHGMNRRRDYGVRQNVRQPFFWPHRVAARRAVADLI